MQYNRKKNRKLLKPVGSRPGVICDSCKAHKASVENCLPFWPILSALNISSYKLAKLLVQLLKPLATNEFSVKDSFPFAEEIVDQKPDFFMGSLDVDSLSTNIPLKEIIDIYPIDFFKESQTVEGLRKSKFKKVLSRLLKICILFLMEHFINNRWCGHGFSLRPYIS